MNVDAIPIWQIFAARIGIVMASIEIGHRSAARVLRGGLFECAARFVFLLHGLAACVRQNSTHLSLMKDVLSKRRAQLCGTSLN